tara:strand:+ start:587 stop:1036 length:450 start_codon:yes stop_codon:yes gene_type:complete
MQIDIKKKLYYLVFFIPALAVYIPTIIYPVDDSYGENIQFRPPGYVFAIVWPILLILLGISWVLSLKNKIDRTINILYILLVILLGSWSFFFTLNKIAGLIVIILSLSGTISITFQNIKLGKKLSGYLLIPLIGWLSFATILNIFSILY